jgi:hypothetical protein
MGQVVLHFIFLFICHVISRVGVHFVFLFSIGVQLFAGRVVCDLVMRSWAILIARHSWALVVLHSCAFVVLHSYDLGGHSCALGRHSCALVAYCFLFTVFIFIAHQFSQQNTWWVVIVTGVVVIIVIFHSCGDVVVDGVIVLKRLFVPVGENKNILLFFFRGDILDAFYDRVRHREFLELFSCKLAPGLVTHHLIAALEIACWAEADDA